VLFAGKTDKIDQFNFMVFGLSSVLEECIDIVGKLPEEIIVSILR
jgi:hypothetical protein